MGSYAVEVGRGRHCMDLYGIDLVLWYWHCAIGVGDLCSTFPTITYSGIGTVLFEWLIILCYSQQLRVLNSHDSMKTSLNFQSKAHPMANLMYSYHLHVTGIKCITSM